MRLVVLTLCAACTAPALAQDACTAVMLALLANAQAVSPDAPFRTAITRAVPGLQVTGAMADDVDARWVLRMPEAWNGKLVVGMPGGLRSEFMGDYIFSDFVVQQGYAYASTNKGTLNFFFTAPLADPLACRLSPPPAATARLHTLTTGLVKKLYAPFLHQRMRPSWGQ